ncbi:MAG: MSMEG_0570 family nitrogen starvation response protein [Verrucomicrobiota bacterium]
MPETVFKIQLPDGRDYNCYSPSSIVRKYFSVGDKIPNVEFLKKAQESLKIASDRVEQKFGFQCSGAMNSLHDIEKLSAQFKPEEIIEVTEI